MASKMTWPQFLTNKKQAFLDGYQLGFVEGHRDASHWVKQRIVDDLNHDAVITMTLSTDSLERVVKIVEES
jgi:hypothetical protein